MSRPPFFGPESAAAACVATAVFAAVSPEAVGVAVAA